MEMEVGEREIEGKGVIGKGGLEHTSVASKQGAGRFDIALWQIISDHWLYTII